MILDEFKSLGQLAAVIKTLDMVTAVPWTDYSGTSTIVGWSSSTDAIFYKKIGKLVFVQFYITGTSDDTVVTFTLPYTQQSDLRLHIPIRAEDNGTDAVGLATIAAGNSTCACFADVALGVWTNSGTKTIWGQFWYEAA